MTASTVQLRPVGTRPAGGAGTHPGGRTPGTHPGDQHPGGRPAAGPSRPAGSMRLLAGGFAALYLEVEAGRRPPRQLSVLMVPRLQAQLEAVWIRPGVPGRVIAVTGVRLTPHIYEAVAVVRRHGGRCGALALRLERRGCRWLVTHASRPEDGPLPDPPVPFPDEGFDSFDLVGHAAATCSAVGVPVSGALA